MTDILKMMAGKCQSDCDEYRKTNKDCHGYDYGNAWRSGFQSAFECEAVKGMREAIAYVLQYDQNSPERKRLGDALAAFEKLVGGGE